MKRYANLFDSTASFPNLLSAARKARQGCTNTQESRRFLFHLEPELLTLQRELNSQTYTPGPYRFFFVSDPKKRRIAVAPFRDRVVHHAVVNILGPIYERSFIHDSYATRPGKGTHAAILRAQAFTRRWPWHLKADIDKYFDSVDHQTLLGALRRKILDRRMLALLERIIANAPEPGQGLPIGNLTSQFLANVYLDPFDHFVKEELRIKGYLRYMDDFVLFAENRKALKDLRPLIQAYLAVRLGLRIKPTAVWINRSTHGLTFLGMRIFPGLLRVRPENLRRCQRRMANKLRLWKQGRITETALRDSLVSSAGHVRMFCPHLDVGQA